MKKVLKVIGIILALVLYSIAVNAIIAGCLAFKDSLQHNSKEKFDSLISSIVFKDSINISHKEVNDYLVFDDFKIRNDFKNFEQSDSSSDDSIKYANYIYKDVKNRILVSFDIDISEDNSQINGSYNSDFINKYNITNDIDYIKALKEYEYKDFVLSYNKWLLNEGAMLGAEGYSLTQEGDYYRIIEGDYSGLAKHSPSETSTVVYLYGNNKTYKLTFNSLGYFTDEDIYDLISTVVIG
ncbi:MAG: hypothetical protein IJL74_00870 [Bacilli bacterium]|nr:hypothetical protein [Bacilli bacterium]